MLIEIQIHFYTYCLTAGVVNLNDQNMEFLNHKPQDHMIRDAVNKEEHIEKVVNANMDDNIVAVVEEVKKPEEKKKTRHLQLKKKLKIPVKERTNGKKILCFVLNIHHGHNIWLHLKKTQTLKTGVLKQK